LILQAEEIAWQRWPSERLYTYVNSRKIRSCNPGYCFQKAGWKKCGVTVSLKLLILEKYPRIGSEQAATKNNIIPAALAGRL
jgi:hypothetical protein